MNYHTEKLNWQSIHKWINYDFFKVQNAYKFDMKFDTLWYNS
jgi:hypothetical protein